MMGTMMGKWVGYIAVVHFAIGSFGGVSSVEAAGPRLRMARLSGGAREAAARERIREIDHIRKSSAAYDVAVKFIRESLSRLDPEFGQWTAPELEVISNALLRSGNLTVDAEIVLQSVVESRQATLDAIRDTLQDSNRVAERWSALLSIVERDYVLSRLLGRGEKETVVDELMVFGHSGQPVEKTLSATVFVLRNPEFEFRVAFRSEVAMQQRRLELEAFGLRPEQEAGAMVLRMRGLREDFRLARSWQEDVSWIEPVGLPSAHPESM